SARPLELTSGGSDPPIAFLQTGASSYSVAPGASAAAPPLGAPGVRTVGAAVVVAVPRGAAVGAADGSGTVAPIVAAAGRGEKQGPGRVIVYGDADFATNGVIDYLGNKDLLANSVNWLARDEGLIAARAPQAEVGREQFFVTEAQARTAFWLAAVAQPLVFL